MGARARQEAMPAAAWPEDSPGTRVLVEEPDGATQWAMGVVLGRAGYTVMTCEGPGPRAECCLVAKGECALVEGADVIVNSGGLHHRDNVEVLQAIQTHAPDTPLVVEASAGDWKAKGNELAGSEVRLLTPATPASLLSRVREALAGKTAAG